MTLLERSTVVGVFDDAKQAEAALTELRQAGFQNEQLGVAVRVVSPPAADPDDLDPKTEEGAATGIFTGGILGAVLGAVVTGLIPGVGPALAAGMLAGILGGAAVGAAAGGLVGTLIGMGIPEDEARYYQWAFEAGRTLVTVRTEGRASEAFAILRRHGARDVEAQSHVCADTPAQVP